MEGTHCFNPQTGCDMSNKVLPITEYPHTDGIAVIGGYVYKGTAIASLANKYIFADLTGKMWSLTEASANTWTRGDLLNSNLHAHIFRRGFSRRTLRGGLQRQYSEIDYAIVGAESVWSAEFRSA